MSQFDVAIGMDATTLDTGASQLYASVQAREKFFKGSERGEQGGLRYTVSWDVQAAPTFTLAPPPEEKWKASIDAQGRNPRPEDRPVQNTLQLVFPRFHGQYEMKGAQVSGATQVIVYVTVAIQDNTLAFTPRSIWLDESGMSGWDKFILNQIILKQVLQRAQQLLSGLQLPPLSFSQEKISIELTPPQLIIEGKLLILAASMKSKGSVDLSGFQWPVAPFFTLISPDLLEQVGQQATKSYLVGQKHAQEDCNYKDLLKYSYAASVVSAESIASNPNDRTKLSAKLGLSFSATLKPLGVGGPCAITAATRSI